MKLTKEMQKSEIENLIKNCGDFVKIDHLTRLLKERIPTDTRKFVMLKLGEIYERRFMFTEAARCYENAADCSITFNEKIKYYVQEAELFVKAGNFPAVEEAMKKAMVEANQNDRREIYESVKGFYKKQGEQMEKEMKRGHAAKIYEKLLEMNLSDEERKAIKFRLVNLYEKLGKVKEFIALKRNLEEGK